MSIRQKAAELSKNQKAVAVLVKIAAFLVIVAVVLYCDIQFIQVMWKTFPNGAAKIFSLIGAVATGASVLALIAAEAFWFSRGPQMVFGYIFTGIEVLISVCNVILSFEMSGGTVDSFMAIYLWICPATPVVAALCWVIVFNLDEGQKARHDHREMQDDIAEADRDHTKAVHESKMKLKTRYLESTTTYLEQIADDPRIQAGLQAGAWKFATDELRNLTGLVMPAHTVEGSISPASQPAKIAEKKPDPDPTPEPEKKRGWFKNPFAREEQPPVYTNRPDLAAKVQEAARQTIREERERPHASSSVADARRARRAARMRGAATPDNYQATETAKKERKQAVGPTTEKLSPFPQAPTPSGNGAKMNGRHPKPMMQ